MKVGFSKVEITPEISLRGSYRSSRLGRAKGIHDPLYARWMVVESAGGRWALLSLDLVYLETHLAKEWKEELSLKSKIPHITLACTHTHNGPNVCDSPEWCDPVLVSRTFGSVHDGLVDALSRLQEAEFAWAEGDYNLSINRHERSAGRGDGPVDSTIGLLLVKSGSQHLGHVVHYAAHPTTAKSVGEQISGDYPAILLRETESAWGGIGLFLLGAAGNINLETEARSYERSEFHGKNLAHQCIQAAQDVSYEGIEHLGFHSETFRARRRSDLPSADVFRAKITELDFAQEAFQQDHPNEEIPGRIWNRKRVLQVSLRTLELFGEQVDVAVDCVELAGRILIFVPGEWFVEYSVWLRQRFPHKKPLWVNCANGYMGYVPTRSAYREKGTYVDQPGFINFLEEGEGEALFEKIAGLVETLQ